jgi:protein-glucosylgalactosylhydroxylysine glucosidase
MLMYPSLDMPMSAQIRRNDFDYTMISVKEGHRQPHGMSLAPASIAAAVVGDAPLAVTWLQNNFTSGLIKPPFNVRTETANNNTGHFITASGGFVQTLLYGLSGLRIQEKGLVEAYAPVLPPEWKSMTLKGITFRGQRYDVTVDRDASGRVKLTRKML